MKKIIHGAFESTWGHTFYRHAELIKTWSLMAGIVDSRFWIKVMALWSFPICLHREAKRLQCFLLTRYVSGCGHAHTYICDSLDPICSKQQYRKPASLSGSIMHVATHVALSLSLSPSMWWYLDSFFFCLVCRLLHPKLKNTTLNVIHWEKYNVSIHLRLMALQPSLQLVPTHVHMNLIKRNLSLSFWGQDIPHFDAGFIRATLIRVHFQ